MRALPATILAVTLAPIVSSSLPAQAGMPPGACAVLDSLIDYVVAREYTPGIGVAIVRDGRADVVAETQRIHARFTARYFEVDRFGYGLGWNFGTLDGDTLVHHFGGFPGFSAAVSFQPSRRIGVIVAGNGVYSNGIQDPVMGYTYALLAGKDSALGRYRRMLAGIPTRAEQERQAIAADRARRAARPQTTALPFEAFVGRYEHDTFGSLEVTLRDGRLHVRNGVLEGVAEVFDGTKNQLRVELTPGSGSVVEFVSADGRITAAILSGTRLERVR